MYTKYTIQLNKTILFISTLLLALGFLFKVQERVFTSDATTGTVLASYIPARAVDIQVTNTELDYAEANKKVNSLAVDQAKVSRIRNYLAKRGSPLVSKAEYLVKMADEFNIDFRLVAAISIIESSGGKHTYRPYNAWGWGGRSGAYSFTSWEQAIYTVSRGLSRYYSSGLVSPRQIAPRYNPDTPNEWAGKVEFVMGQI